MMKKLSFFNLFRKSRIDELPFPYLDLTRDAGQEIIYMQEIELRKTKAGNEVFAVTIRAFETKEGRDKYVAGFKPFNENTTVFQDVTIGHRIQFA